MSLGDDEHPISILFETTERGEHVHVRVRAGIKGMRANCGSFVMRREEWLVLRDNLTYSEPIDSKLAAAFGYAPEGHVSHLQGVRIIHFDSTPIEITSTSVAERDAAMFARVDTVSEQLRESLEEVADPMEPFIGDIVLSCGHGWPGSCETTAAAEEFLALCLATGDTVICSECKTSVAITGPLRAKS